MDEKSNIIEKQNFIIHEQQLKIDRLKEALDVADYKLKLMDLTVKNSIESAKSYCDMQNILTKQVYDLKKIIEKLKYRPLFILDLAKWKRGKK